MSHWNISPNAQLKVFATLKRLDSTKKVGNFHFLCLVQVTRTYIAVEETLLGFVLVSKRVPRCKEEAVL